MPWQTGTPVRDNGDFTGSQVWQDDATAGTKILASNHDNHDQDMADMIGECLHRGGQNAMLADADWGGYRINNLGDPVVDGDAANKAYVDTAIDDGLDTLHPVATSGLYAALSGRPSLSTVATTGDYDDLIGKPVAGAGSVHVARLDVSGEALTTSQEVVNNTLIDPEVLVGTGSFSGNTFRIDTGGTYRVTLELEIVNYSPGALIRFQALPYINATPVPISVGDSRTFRVPADHGRDSFTGTFVIDFDPGNFFYFQFRYDTDAGTTTMDYTGTIIVEKIS